MSETTENAFENLATKVGEIAQLAVDAGDQLEKLDLGTMTIHGDRAKLFAAIAKAQAGYAAIKRTRTVKVKSDRGDYSFDYAPLEEVIAATLPSLNANGVAWVCMRADGEPGVADLHTMLTHESGAFVHVVEKLSTLAVAKDGSEYPMKAQEFGSQLTYRRRYQYQCLAGCSPEVDDDGNAAEGNKVEAMAQRRPEPRREPPAPKPVRTPAESTGMDPAMSREKRPSEPPKQLTQELTDRGVIRPPPAEGDDDSQPAKSNEMLDQALHDEFSRLKGLGKNKQELMILAKKATGVDPNVWTIRDGREFLKYTSAEFPQ